ncbi:MAG: hypothetical protein QXK65_01085 [Candidatus Micrarchaeaceae archaeon]
MVTVDDVLEDLSGMVTRETAERIAEEGTLPHPASAPSSQDFTDVAGLLSFIASKPSVSLTKSLFQPQQAVSSYTVNVRDNLYRIFNPVEYNYGSKKGVKREVVLGREGKTIKLTLFDKASDRIDTEAFERGDIVLVRNAALLSSGSLKGINKTLISRVVPSSMPLPNFSSLKGGEKNIDVIGKAVEIYPIKYVNRLDGLGQIGVANCTLSDSTSLIRAVFWGSSAVATANFNVGDILKIEFCSVRMSGEEKELYVNDLSRVFSNRLLESRFAFK